MAATNSSAALSDRARRGSDFCRCETQFAATPDTWSDLARLERGADPAVASAVARAVAGAEPAQRATIEARLLRVLALPSCSPAGRMFVARMLALLGSAQCVPAFAPLLHDAATADTVRYFLDAIDDPAVDTAYRAALEKLTGAPKAGLIGSIALRGDTRALPALCTIFGDATETAEVHEAAERAIEWLDRRVASGHGTRPAGS